MHRYGRPRMRTIQEHNCYCIEGTVSGLSQRPDGEVRLLVNRRCNVPGEHTTCRIPRYDAYYALP